MGLLVGHEALELLRNALGELLQLLLDLRCDNN